MRLNEAKTGWEAVGSAGFSAGEVWYTSLAFGPDNKPYVAYQDVAMGGIATVMRWTQSVASLPGEATNVVAQAGYDSARVSFDVPANTGGTGIVIERYTVTSSPGGIDCPVSINPASTQRSCTAEGLQSDTTYTFSVVATNTVGDGPVATSNEVTPKLGLRLSAPTVVPDAPMGQPYQLALTASGGSGGYVYALAPGSPSLPDGLSLDPNTGVISGTPTVPVGTYTVSVVVSDSEDHSVILELQLTIAAAPAPTSVTPVPTLSQWALLLMALGMGGLGALGARRSRQG